MFLHKYGSPFLNFSGICSLVYVPTKSNARHMRKEGNKSRSNLYKNEVDLNVNVRKQKQNMLLEIEN